ncbi:spore germination protein [Sporosarcina sp. CAU 1771]
MEPTDKKIDLDSLKQLFQKSGDVQFQSYTFNHYPVVFITCDSMIDQQLLNEVIVPRVQQFIENLNDDPLENLVSEKLHIPNLKKIEDKKEIGSLLYTGSVLLYFKDDGLLISSNIEKKPNRNPEDTNIGAPIRGPRDNFIEDISVNIALIRKRIPTNSLCVEKFQIGKRSRTTVALLYFDDIASKDTLASIKSQLEEVDTDIVVSGDLLMEDVNKSALLFPRTDYSGRPDFVVESLATGRFVILVDGVAYAIITPVNLLLLLKTSEDNETPVIYNSFERLLRIAGMTIGICLPAFWLALTTFHQDQLPHLLLATVVQSNTGLPLPSVIEMLIMILMFELFREAGLRLPSALGGTIGVVGGLIIGDAAIRAGITSPAMIVIIATSTIATFTLVNQSVVTAVSILRIFFIFLTAFFGMFGFIISFFCTVLYLSNIRIFGVPYLNNTADLSWKEMRKTYLRLPAGQYKERPNVLNPTDKTRKKEGEK